jgi:chemotaxis regulatin CheY-phosphate phosphatase CheZ
MSQEIISLLDSYRSSAKGLVEEIGRLKSARETNEYNSQTFDKAAAALAETAERLQPITERTEAAEERLLRRVGALLDESEEKMSTAFSKTQRALLGLLGVNLLISGVLLIRSFF